MYIINYALFDSACVYAQSLPSYPTLCDPMDCNLLDFSILEITKQEHWSGLPCPPPRDLPDPGVELMSPVSLALQVDSVPLGHQGNPFILLCF